MPNYERARKTMRSVVAAAKDAGPLDLMLGVGDALAGAADTAMDLAGFGSLSGVSGLIGLVRAISDEDDGTVLPNVNFVTNGHDDADSPMTAAYFKGRYLKNVGGSAFSLIGVGASVGTAGVNVAGAIQHANATGTTLVHLLQLGRLAANDRYKASVTIADWLRVLLLAKSLKAAVRGASLVGAVVPAASLGVGIATSVAKFGIKMTLKTVAYSTAQAIHWRAFQEQAISGGLGLGNGRGVGPASQMYWEMFTRRGLTRVFGTYNIAGLVKEPAGWLPLADKIMLI